MIFRIIAVFVFLFASSAHAQNVPLTGNETLLVQPNTPSAYNPASAANQVTTTGAIASLGASIVVPGASIQGALNALPPTGGQVYIKAGAYPQTTTLIASSNTQIVCEPGASITASSVGWTGTSKWLLTNLNNAASSITDHDIVVQGCAFVAQGTFAADGGFHHIHFRMAQHILIDGKNSFSGGGDGTAMLATLDTKVVDDYMTGSSNACWDHFEAPASVTVTDNYCETAVYGVLVTGSAAVASNGVALGGSIKGNTIKFTSTSFTQAGIWLNGLGTTGSGASNITVSNNYLFGNGTGNFVCLRVSGASVDNLFSSNTCKNSGTTSIGFQTSSDTGGLPSNSGAIGNIFDGIQVQAGDVAVIKLNGTNTYAQDNRVYGGSYPYAIALTGTNNVAVNNFADTGTTAIYNTAGSTNPTTGATCAAGVSASTGTSFNGALTHC